MTAAAKLYEGAVTPSRVQAYAGRALDLLQAIEKTIDCLSENCDLLGVMSAAVVKHLKTLQQSSYASPLDPEGRVCELLSKCLDSIERMHHTAVKRRDAAQADERLQDDDGVVEAYEAFIVSLSEHHDIVHEFKDWVETHDALQAPAVGPVYGSADELFKAVLEKA